MADRRTQDAPGSPPAEGPRVEHFELGGQTFAVISLPQDAPCFDALTAAERDIAHCVLSGLSDEEIAGRRGTSPRTVAKQLRTIYAKLGVASRAELVVRALQG